MVFAITDIETTGSYPSGNSITEIAICIHDGEKVIHRFESLVDPGVKLPPFIVSLTGITDDMLEKAPSFANIAEEVHGLLSDCIFVAHNVNFDYSFIKASFDAVGLRWNPTRLCTVRLARKAFPGLRSYGLANLCRELGIHNEAAHRAMGDTRATVEVFERALALLGPEGVRSMIARGTGEAFLPNNVSSEDYNRLPERPGIYYFLDNSGKPLYIGKARNIRKRVRGHFTGTAESSRRQSFLTEISHIDYTETANELIALLVEDAEIRRHWPRHNKAQKKRPGRFGVFQYMDRLGYVRIVVNALNSGTSPMRVFSTKRAAHKWVMEIGEEHGLDLRLLGFPVLVSDPLPEVDVHNEQLERAFGKAMHSGETLAFLSRGRQADEQAFVLVKNGQLKGYGFIPGEAQVNRADDLADWLQPIPLTETNASIIRSYIEDPRGLRIVRWE